MKTCTCGKSITHPDADRCLACRSTGHPDVTPEGLSTNTLRAPILWFVFATPPRKPGQRKSRIFRYVALACDAAEARRLAIEDNPQHDRSTAYDERPAEVCVVGLGPYLE